MHVSRCSITLRMLSRKVHLTAHRRFKLTFEPSAPICCKQLSSSARLHMADMADEDMNESMEMSAQIWTAFQHMAPYLDKTLKLEQNAAPPKRPRKGEPAQQTHPKTMANNVNLALAMSQLAKLALKLDRDMQLMKKEDTYIFFFGNKGPDSCINLLMQKTETWAQEHQLQRQGQQKTPMLPLRLKLMQVVFNTLLTKLDQLATAKEGSDLKTRALQTLVLLPDGTCPYLEWDAQARQLKVSQRKPLTLKHLHQICTDMLEALSDVHLVMRFHSLPMTNNKEVTPWRLQLSMRADQPWQLMQLLCHSAIWLTMGGSLKMHSLQQSPLAHQLQKTLGLTQPTTKGQGKGKTKSKGQTAKKEEP